MTEPINDSTSEKPLVIKLLSENGITRRGIGRQLGLYPAVVNQALDTERFVDLPYRRLIAIRIRVERLLRAAGWNGKTADLCAEYDKKLAA